MKANFMTVRLKGKAHLLTSIMARFMWETGATTINMDKGGKHMQVEYNPYSIIRWFIL